MDDRPYEIVNFSCETFKDKESSTLTTTCKKSESDKNITQTCLKSADEYLICNNEIQKETSKELFGFNTTNIFLEIMDAANRIETLKKND